MANVRRIKKCNSVIREESKGNIFPSTLSDSLGGKKRNNLNMLWTQINGNYVIEMMQNLKNTVPLETLG